MTEQNFFRMQDDAAYRQWIEEYDTRSPAALERLRAHAQEATAGLSIAVVPLCDVEHDASQLARFEQMLSSQLLTSWTCVPASPDVRNIVEIARRFDCVLPLPVDVQLDPTAVAELALALDKSPKSDMAYGDEDSICNGVRRRPQFKPDWDPYFILGRNFVGVPALYRSAALLRGNMLATPPGQGTEVLLYALALHAGAEDRVIHVPRVLAHRASSPDWDRKEAAAVLEAHLISHGDTPSAIGPAPLAPASNRVRFALPDPVPCVSIIVPTKDRPELIGPCIKAVLEETAYPRLELLIVDNGTTNPEALAIIDAAAADPRVRVLRDDRPFNFSRLNNAAARVAKGEILLLLNNDTKALHPDWLTELASLACRADVGVVGARLLYPDLRIQHSGVGIEGGPGPFHQMRLAGRDETGPCHELALLRSAWAVTGACLAIRKDLYFEVGGLDEENFVVAFNDIDLCLKVARKGLRNLCSPYAELLHFESVSRGLLTSTAQYLRETGELEKFWAHHRERYGAGDTHTNPQVEHRGTFVDFARPPRPHPFRLELDWRPSKQSAY